MNAARITPLARRSAVWLLGHPLTWSLGSFFALSLLSFRRNAVYLFYGLDGRYEVSLVALGTLFTRPLPLFTNDFIHGLGNIWFPLNPWFVPGYVLSLSAYGDFNDFPLAYAICAGLFFAEIFFCGRLIGASRGASLIAAWMVPLLTFQYVGWNLIPSTFRAFPHYATVAGATTLVAALLLTIGRSRPLTAAVSAGCAFLGISYIVIVAPALLILGAPLFAVAGLVALLAARRQPRFVLRIALMGAIPALCVACGHASFLIGLTADTAASFFPNLSIRPGGLGEASLLFWGPWTPLFTVERGFIFVGLLGGVWTALFASGTLRLAAIAFLATALIYLAVGIVHAFHPFWLGPAFWYFEGFLVPFHGIFAAVLLCDLMRRAIRLVPAVRRRFEPFGRTPAATALLTLAIAVVPWLYVAERLKHADAPNLPYGEPHPQRETAITRILKEEIALAPGSTFRGREATLTGRIFPLSTNVDIVGRSGIPDILALQVTGNLHSFAGLWQDAIPTLLEYSPLLTPAYFAFGRTFFTEPADRQIRNLLAMRRIDPRMLAAVGVRFFVTDAPFDGDVRLRQTIQIPITRDMLSRLAISYPVPDFSLYLYEIASANLGQYSPTEIHQAKTAAEMLDAIADSSFNLALTGVSSETLPGGLTPARFEGLVVEPGFYRLKAASDGWSVLVLPMEYSRCLRLDAGSVAAGARLFRIDLLMTGVLFNKNIDARLAYRTGPFIGSRCRIEDADEMRAIRIGEAFSQRPELAPIPITHY